MFDLYPVSESSARRGWSFAGSLIIQVIGIAGLVLLPLLNTYEINPGDWLATAFSLAAPPPPAPAPQLVDPSPRPETVRYEADLRSPVAIPDRVALLHDNVMPVSPLGGISTLQGLSGGLGVSGSVGVVGMVLHGGQYLPLPPPIRVGGRLQSARMTHKVQPTYPQDAIEQNVTGTVKLEAIITTNGSVRDVKLINGHPLLAAAAIKSRRAVGVPANALKRGKSRSCHAYRHPFQPDHHRREGIKEDPETAETHAEDAMT